MVDGPFLDRFMTDPLLLKPVVFIWVFFPTKQCGEVSSQSDSQIFQSRFLMPSFQEMEQCIQFPSSVEQGKEVSIPIEGMCNSGPDISILTVVVFVRALIRSSVSLDFMALECAVKLCMKYWFSGGGIFILILIFF